MKTLRKLKIFRKDFSGSNGASCMVFFGKTQIVCSAFLDPSSGRGDEDSLYRDERGVPGESITRESAKRIAFLMIDVDVLSSVGLSIDFQVLQSDGGIKTALVAGIFHTLSFIFQEWDKSIPVKKIVGLSCGTLKGSEIMDLDAQESFQAETFLDFIFDENGKVLELLKTSSRDGGLSLDSISSMGREAFSVAKGLLSNYGELSYITEDQPLCQVQCA